ncbi:hypothetical protein H5410_022845 [Solanum commersonii]|uniref:Uncharacterized protein n=1 Tax=Solanum commersonii TaxID=4109 RepID=A0A9J5ZIR5_SOLCO|nr:hypothetical protein H5410_022845 [Solanum commersonii]
MEGTSGELEKEKILSDKVEMKSNEVEHNETQEPQPPSPPMPPSLLTKLSPLVEYPQKLQRRKSGTKELATSTSASYVAVQNAGDEFCSLR